MTTPALRLARAFCAHQDAVRSGDWTERDEYKEQAEWQKVLAAEAAFREAEGAGTEPLTFEQFQSINVQRCTEAFKHGLDDWSLLEWAGAAAGEMGEAANVCKKLRRQMQGVGGSWAARDPEADVLRAMLADEIGDVLAYLSLLASAAGLDLAKCGADKFDKVSDKVDWSGPRLATRKAPPL